MPVWWYFCWLIILIVFQRRGHCISHELCPAVPSEILLSMSASLLSAWEYVCTWTLIDVPLWLMIDFKSNYVYLFSKNSYEWKNYLQQCANKNLLKAHRGLMNFSCRFKYVMIHKRAIQISYTSYRYHWYTHCQLLLFHIDLISAFKLACC